LTVTIYQDEVVLLLLTPILAVQLIVLEDFLSEYGIIVFSNLCNLPSFLREDEEKCVSVLQQLIHEFAPECYVCGSAGHVDSAVRLIENTQPRVIFLDIRIADGTAFDVLQRLSSRDFELVFVTAYDSYALEAIKHAAIDYLLKPIGIPEFEASVERLRKRLSEKVQYNTVESLLKKLVQQGGHEKLAIPTASGFEFISMQDILWCKSDGMYTTFYLSDKSKVVCSRNLGMFEDQLTQNNFFRIHHSIMINMRWIKQYVKGKGGSVVLTDGMKLQVSQRRKAEFMDKFLSFKSGVRPSAFRAHRRRSVNERQPCKGALTPYQATTERGAKVVK